MIESYTFIIDTIENSINRELSRDFSLFALPFPDHPSFLHTIFFILVYLPINIALTVSRSLYFFFFSFLSFCPFPDSKFSILLHLLLFHPLPASLYFFNTFTIHRFRRWIYLKIISFEMFLLTFFSTAIESIRWKIIFLNYIILYLKFRMLDTFSHLLSLLLLFMAIESQIRLWI